ncbi:Rieske 2Fe-2S domain-containing protein [Pseudomonas sp. 148P]|uniref:Rieske 2Fe-2S domain-containing protein n=1 Tax=Pseudomonas ulcerans TaxID=3115852 RepID=A0ABU7HYN4_9PSED|nr:MULTISPECIES: Rieske 2Fe-2S domain-containing protein [unclassified Pseudomonas]MEE1925705.1 Rieske 2Fe-2S domain-containing protein [Pseudomonas sp. 147P]MEE1936681.1 Rieske 2Fe-2S domain-containing protein [Pseudomonas sp. 148P]
MNSPAIACQDITWNPITRTSTFTPQDREILTRHWHPVAFSAEVTDKPHAVILLDEPVVLYRTGERINAARDICSHRGAPLSKGWVQGDNIICPYHGLHFGTNGRCTRIPSEPNANLTERHRIQIYQAREEYGLVWVLMAGDSAPFAEMPTWHDSSFQRILPPAIDIAASAGRQVEGFIDVAHFAWIHHEAFAERDNPVVPTYKAEVTPYGVHAEYVSNVSNFPKALQHRAPDDFLWTRTFDVFAPFTARLSVDFPSPGERLVILNAASPISARKTRMFCAITRNFDQDLPLADVYAFNQQVFEEDRDIVELCRPEDLPLDLSLEIHIPADRSSTAYRRALSALGLGRAFTS